MHTYKKTQTSKWAFIKNSIFGTNRDPWLLMFLICKYARFNPAPVKIECEIWRLLIHAYLREKNCCEFSGLSSVYLLCIWSMMILFRSLRLMDFWNGFSRYLHLMDISKGHLLLISSIGKSTDHVSSISPGYHIFINNDHLYFGTTLSFSIMIWRSVSKILQFSCFDRWDKRVTQ